MLSLTLRRPINYKITASPKKQNISVGEQLNIWAFLFDETPTH